MNKLEEVKAEQTAILQCEEYQNIFENAKAKREQILFDNW